MLLKFLQEYIERQPLKPAILDMEYDSFIASLNNAQPPVTLSAYLQALWYDGKGNWDKSHDIIQDIDDRRASWIHAYLHRKEGDEWNARYWYNRAKKSFPELSLDEEWAEIVRSELA